MIAGWSSPVARQAHNLKVVGSNPTPATNLRMPDFFGSQAFFLPYSPIKPKYFGVTPNIFPIWTFFRISAIRMIRHLKDAFKTSFLSLL